MLELPPSPKFHSILLYASCFPDTGHSKRSAPNCPEMTLNTKRSKMPHICCKYSRVPNFTQFCSTAGRFWVTGHFERSAPNDKKMTLNTKRSKVLNIQITTTPESKISLNFALRPAISQIQAILREVHRMILKWLWTQKGQRYPICMLQQPPSPRFHPYALHRHPFSSYRPFWDKCTERPQMTLNTKRSKVPHICCISNLSPNFHPISLYGQPFSSYRPICDKYTKWSQHNLEH